MSSVIFCWKIRQIQCTVDPHSLNTDGSFTMANSNLFFSSYEILSAAQVNKYLGIFLFYYKTVYCVYSLDSPQRGDSDEYTQNTITYRGSKRFP